MTAESHKIILVVSLFVATLLLSILPVVALVLIFSRRMDADKYLFDALGPAVLISPILIMMFANIYNLARSARAFDLGGLAAAFGFLLLMALLFGLPGARSWSAAASAELAALAVITTAGGLLAILVQWGLTRWCFVMAKGAR